MSMNLNGQEPETSATEAEGVLFAAAPAWERNRKRRGFGYKKAAAEPRVIPADEPAMTLERPVAARPVVTRPVDSRVDPILDRPMTTTNSTLAAEEAPLAAPIARPTTIRARKSNSAAPAAIAAGLVAVAALGGIGWWAAQPHDGVPELAPGTTDSQVAVAPVMPAAAPTEVAANTAAPPPAMATPRAAAPVRSSAAPVARTRPAAAPSAADANGVNVSAVAATLPDAPQPYSALNPGATPPAVTPAAPAPVVEAAPEAVPATPPIAPQATPAAPPTENPAAPTPETPPTS